MKKVYCIFLVICLSTGLFMIFSCAENTQNYKEVYMDFAKDAENDDEHALNDAISGLILLDLNRDGVPELLVFSTSVSHFDEEGKRIYSNEDNYDNPAYKEYLHNIEKAFSIIGGEVVEDSPWYYGGYSAAIYMPFLPDEDGGDTEEFCTIVQHTEGGVYLAMRAITEWGSSLSTLWYDEEGFGFLRGDFDENFSDTYSFIDLPVASISFYNEDEKRLRSRSEAMEILLSKYENAVNEESDGEYDEINELFPGVSDWAKEDIARAYGMELIPEELYYTDMNGFVSRGEFAAIAVKLYEKLTGSEIMYEETPFSDIGWQDIPIKKAYTIGIIKGVSENSFEPDTDVSREQIAAMFLRLFKLYMWPDWSLEKDSEYPVNYPTNDLYTDHENISEYAIPAVYFMRSARVVIGIDSMYFAPNTWSSGDFGRATREQAIVMALRLYDFLNRDIMLSRDIYITDCGWDDGIDINDIKDAPINPAFMPVGD